MANPQHLKWLEEGVKAWNMRRAGNDFLPDPDLEAAEFTGFDLRGANLRNANLRGAQLIEARLTGADLAGALLMGSDLTGASLVGAILAETVLDRANLEEANLEGAGLEGASLRGTNLTSTNVGMSKLEAANVRSFDVTDGHVVTFEASEGSGRKPSMTTDLSRAIGLTQEQLNSMRGDRWTKVPADLKNPWLDDDGAEPELGASVGSPPTQEALENPDIAEARRRIDDNCDAIMLLTTDLKIKIGAYRDRVRVSNSLGEEAKLGLYGMLDELTHDVDAIARSLPSLGEATTEAQAEIVLTRGQRAIKRLEQNLNEYFGLYNLMDAAVPIGIILGFSVMGGLVAGAVGFGAGGLVGKLIVKHLKPGDAMDEASEL
ncbi:MAG: pentapeptide repeat-containing protein [Pseudomonadota bacterium]